MSVTEMKHCWDIIECQDTENCKAWQFQNIPCWKIEQNTEAEQNTLNVCSECKVYILNTSESVSTEKTFPDIMLHQEIMKFVKKCPAYNNKLLNDDSFSL